MTISCVRAPASSNMDSTDTNRTHDCLNCSTLGYVTSEYGDALLTMCFACDGGGSVSKERHSAQALEIAQDILKDPTYG